LDYYLWGRMKSLVCAMKSNAGAWALESDNGYIRAHKKGKTLSYDAHYFTFTKGHNVHIIREIISSKYFFSLRISNS